MMSFPYQRLVSRLVLLSFFFQTLWPSVVFADPLLAEIRAARGRAKHLSLSLEAFVGDHLDPEVDFGKYSPPRVQVKSKVGLRNLQKAVKESLEVQNLYPDLRLTAQGLTWLAYGVSFSMTYQGDLFLSGSADSLEEQSKHPLLNVFNPHGDVILGDGLNLGRVQARAKNVYQTGTAFVRSLEVWAQGGEVYDDPAKRTAEKGSFKVDRDGNLTTKFLTIHEGATDLEGKVSLLEEGVVDAKGGTITHKGQLDLKAEVTIRNVSDFQNEGVIAGSGLILDQVTLTNIDTVAVDELTTKSGEFYNNGRVTVKQWTQGGQKFVNALGSAVKVSEQSTFGAAEVLNNGTLTLLGDSRGTIGTFNNTSELTMGSVSGLEVGAFSSTGMWEVTGSLAWSGASFKTERITFRDKAHLIVPLIETVGGLIAASELTLVGDWHHSGGRAEIAKLFFKGRTIKNQAEVEIAHFPEEAPRKQQTIGELENDSGNRDQQAVFTVKRGTGFLEKVINRGSLALEEGFYLYGQLDNKDGFFEAEWLAVQKQGAPQWILDGAIKTKYLSFTKDSGVTKIINRGKVLCRLAASHVAEFVNEAAGQFTLQDEDDSLGTSQFTVKRFYNHGTFQALVPVMWAGESFETSGPMTLAKDATIKADNIETGDQFKAESTLTLNGNWRHRKGKVDIAKLDFKGKEIENYGEVLIRELLGQNAYPKPLIAKLENGVYQRDKAKDESALFRIMKGGASFNYVVNWGSLVLDDGWYCFDTLVNGGSVEVDWLVPTGSEDFKLCNTLHAKNFDTYRFRGSKIVNWSNANTTFDYAAIKTKVLENSGNLTIGSHGVSEVGTLENTGTLTLENRAEIKTDALYNNRGTIQSKMSHLRVLILDPAQKPQSYDGYPTVRVLFKDKKPNKNNGHDGLILGTLKADKDLIIELDACLHVAECLYWFGHQWQCGGVLRAYADIFRADHPFTYPGAVFLKVRGFQNDKHHLKFRSLEVRADTFRNGKSNDEMGLIETCPDKENPEAGTSLEITVKGDLDNRYGKIFGHGEATLRSTDGDVLAGERITETKRAEAWAAGHSIAYPYYEPNGSYVSSNGHLTLEGQNVNLCLAEVRTQGQLWLIAEKNVRSLASDIFAKDLVVIKGERFDHEILGTDYNSHGYRIPHGRWDELSYDYHQMFQRSRSATLQSLNSIKFNTPVIRCYGSSILAADYLISQQGVYWEGTKNDCPFIEIASQELYRVYYEHNSKSKKFFGGSTQYGPHEAGTILAQVQAGKDVKLEAKEVRNSGQISGYQVQIAGDAAVFQYLGRAVQALERAGVISAKDFIKASKRGFIRQFADGTIGYAHPMIEGARPLSLADTPVAEQLTTGLPAEAKFYMTLTLEVEATQRIMAYAMARLHYQALSGMELYEDWLRRGQRLGQQGALMEPALTHSMHPFAYYALQKVRHAETDEEKLIAILNLFIPPELQDQPESGGVRSHETLLLDVAGDVDLIGGHLRSDAGSVEANIGGNFRAAPVVARHGGGENYHDVLVARPRSTAAGAIKVNVGGNSIRQAMQTSSGAEGTHFTAGGTSADLAVALESQAVDRGRRHYHRVKDVRHAVPVHQTAGAYTDMAGNRVIAQAPDITADSASLVGGMGTIIEDVHDTHEEEHRTRSGGGGLFGGSKTTIETSFSSTSRGAQIKTKNPVVLTALDGDVTLVGSSIQAPRVIINAPNGDIQFLAGRNVYQSFRMEKESSAVWQSMEQDARVDVTYSACEFSEDCVVETHARETVLVEKAQGQTLAWLQRLELNGGKLTLRDLEELHISEHFEVEGPTAALGAVVALAVTIATSGAGASIGMAVAGIEAGVSATLAQTLVCGVVQAAFVNVCSRAAVSLLQNNGDILKAAKDLTSREGLKSLFTAMGTAGLDKGFGPLTSRVTMGLINKQKPGEIVAGIVVDEVAKSLAEKIGQGRLAYIPHKVAHAALGAGIGAVSGAVMGGDVEQSAFTAGLGALVAEVVGDALIDPNELGEKAVERATAEGLPMTEETLMDLAKEGARGAIDLSRLSAGVVAMFSGQDVDLAVKAATNAVENNLLNFIGIAALRAPAVLAALARAAAKEGPTLLRKAGDIGRKAAKMARSAKSAMEAIPEEGSGGSGGGAPEPEGPEEPKQLEFKKSNFEPGDHVDMSRFSNRVKQSSNSPKHVDPKSGEYIVKDDAGVSGHGGSYWKLFNKFGERIATFTKEGKFLKP